MLHESFGGSAHRFIVLNYFKSRYYLQLSLLFQPQLRPSRWLTLPFFDIPLDNLLLGQLLIINFLNPRQLDHRIMALNQLLVDKVAQHFVVEHPTGRIRFLNWLFLHYQTNRKVFNI